MAVLLVNTLFIILIMGAWFGLGLLMVNLIHWWHMRPVIKENQRFSKALIDSMPAFKQAAKEAYREVEGG